MAKKNVLTRDGYEKLLAELHDLKTVVVPQIVQQIKDAKAEGDLSENSEYHSAKEKQVLTAKRISDIEATLKDVEIISEKKGKTKGEVTYGSVVSIRMDNGKEFTFRMVPSAEVKVEGDQFDISFESPIGRAVEGKKAGDTVNVRLTEGRQSLEILSVK